MNEPDYWKALEWRLTREIAATRRGAQEEWWCDGFVPGEYFLEGSPQRIAGRVWVCRGQVQEEWKFTLIMEHRVSTRTDITWPSLLPAENVTGWLTFDVSAKTLRIDPSEAVPKPA